MNYLAASFDIKNVFQPAGITSRGIKIFETSAGFGYLASDILLVLTSVSASLAVIFIVVAGIKFVTSGGDPKKLGSASSTLTYAIIGLAVTILAFVVLRIVQFFLKSAVPIT